MCVCVWGGVRHHLDFSDRTRTDFSQMAGTRFWICICLFVSTTNCVHVNDK